MPVTRSDSPVPVPARWRRGLYFITPDTTDSEWLLSIADQALQGGAVLLQYRCKSGDHVLRHEQATALRRLSRARGVTFIVNDDAQLAAAVGADGVHLGQDDGPIDEARAALGAGAVIGVSCYASLERARAARAAGADYVAFGAFFPSPTKPRAACASMALLQATAALGIPRVAIGGVTADNARGLIDAGADLVAVVSGIADAPEPQAAAARIAALF